ncbi:putative cyclic nucleotide-gated ion channel 9 [Abeliophyllum distichum]|uniref:Cyclic nucleotide-gated ion channel 9 n=1 Tax=Abeliophyllum distichum TaxID=126358 RepID=A0ABD1SA44_9LAMI
MGVRPPFFVQPPNLEQKVQKDQNCKALSEVKMFGLVVDDLKFVASQFRRLHGKHMRYIFRFYSQQWMYWAARVIQVAWGHKYNYGKNESLRVRMLERIWLIMLQKPTEPDFTVEDK